MGEVISGNNPELNLFPKVKEKLSNFTKKLALNSLHILSKDLRFAREVSKRNFSEQDNFTGFVFEENDQAYISPFSVFVYGVNAEVLGRGTLIGMLHDKKTGAQEPVVSISDPKSPTGEIELLNQECVWEPIDDSEFEARTHRIKELGLPITPVSQYVMGNTKPVFLPGQS